MNELIPENCKILIVDDVYQNIQILGKILKNKGFLLSFALNGKEALEQVERESFDLILLDIMMPVISGFDVCEKLKSNNKTKDIPVIFISAKVDVESIVKGFKLGAVDYITKPFRPEELLARVHTHLSLKHAQEELVELNATKDKFFSIIAHDLKNPFNAILNFSELLFTNYDSFEKKDKLELIKDIYDSGKNLFKLLENLLSWARIQTSSMEINQVTIHLKLLIDDTISLLSQQAEAKKIQLISNVDTSASVFADFNMISTVIRNLISNAIKYTDENGR
ncbi:Response regulator receiver sensor signal transduction histidine kinase, partial [Candidatus Magnetomorum sp. HK-1]